MQNKSLSRDDLIKLFFEPDFFASNPELAPIAKIVNPCKIAYAKDAAGRCCGANVTIMFPAIDALFTKLAELKEQNSPAIQSFCDFLARKKNVKNASFVVYYRKNKEGRPLRLSLP